MDTELSCLVAAPEHPSLDGAIVRFCDGLAAERRRVAPVDAGSPRPVPALIRRLRAPGTGLRLAAIHDGEILAMATIDVTAPCGPELLVAVAPRWRRQGLAMTVGPAVVARAHARGLERIVVHTDRPWAGLRALGAELGFQVVDLGPGRLDLLRMSSPVSRSA
jgi:GNAT superfamily N-acetyltransferase